MADMNQRPADQRSDENTRAARGIRTGFWAGILGAVVIAIAAAFFIANREDMSSGPQTTGSATGEVERRTSDPAATTPNTPERRQ